MTRDEATPARPVGARFGYLLKHARERLTALSADGLAPFGINGRECLAGASRATDDAERAFLAPLGAPDGERLRQMLQAVISTGESNAGNGDDQPG